MNHFDFMCIALAEAEKAEQKKEVPIGALLVDKDKNIIAKAHNQTITLVDPTAHAEILAIQKGANKISNYRLLDTTLYVTLEPCIMCMGAIVHARLEKVVFGAFDSKWGGAGSIYNIANNPCLNHTVEILSGVCEDECKQMIRNFFKQRRK